MKVIPVKSFVCVVIVSYSVYKPSSSFLVRTALDRVQGHLTFDEAVPLFAHQRGRLVLLVGRQEGQDVLQHFLRKLAHAVSAGPAPARRSPALLCVHGNQAAVFTV